MNLADKPCYPIFNEHGFITTSEDYEQEKSYVGLTFRERLIISLASNSAIVKLIYRNSVDDFNDKTDNAYRLIEQADAIINQLTKE